MRKAPVFGAGHAYDVRNIDGVFCIEPEPGRTVPIRTGGGALLGQSGTVPDGWEPQFVYAGLAPVHILEWRHRNGNEGSWYLDGEMRTIGGSHKDPPPDALAIMREKAAGVFTAIWRRLICGAAAELDARTRCFFLLNQATRTRIAELCKLDLNIESQYVDLDAGGTPRSFHLQTGLPEIQSEHLIALLGKPMQGQTDGALQTGSLTWPSPVDGAPLLTTHAICINYGLILYRLIADGMVFYVVAIYEGFTTPIMVYFPGSNRCFGLGSWPGVVTLIHGQPLEYLLLQHVFNFATLLGDYLASPSQQFVVLFRQSHVAHHLWNELTEVERLLNLVGAARFPEIILVAGAKREIYGPIDAIYPEITGKINRDIDAPHLSEYVYRRKYCVLGTHRLTISSSLTARILDLNLRKPELDRDRRELARIRDEGPRPIVLLGLRVQNRTIVELGDFCVDAARYLVSRAGRAVLILDGGLAQGYGKFESAAHQAETDIVARVKREVAAPGVEIIDTMGSPLARSLFWAAQVHFWIGLWGAGLALYHWICDKPGIAVTSRFNLSQHGELDVYTRNREHPQPISYLPENFVEDDPDAPLLIGNPQHRAGTLMNFHVRSEGLYPLIDQFLEQYGSAAAQRRRDGAN